MDLSTTLNLGKQLTELALTAGRKRQSKQTGFIHLFYPDSDEDIQHTIPVVENLYYALALLRTKSSEQITEAKVLIERLLPFQNGEGNFPIYIHEFPQGKDRFLGAQLLPAFFYILKEFHTILGNELKQQLEDAARKLIKFNLKSLNDRAPFYSIGLKIAATAKGLGIFLNDLPLEQEGNRLLDQFHNQGPHLAWFIPSSLADICIAIQIAYSNIQESLWKDFWQHLINTWHRPSYSFIGPGLRQYQKGEEPQPTLYDLFLGYFSQDFSIRALKEAPYHLQAVLVQATGEILPVVQYPLSIKGLLNQSSWIIYQHDKFAYSLIEKNVLGNPAFDHAFHSLNLVWGNKEKIHSFVCQGGNFDIFKFEAKDNEIEFIVPLSQNYDLESREKNRELAFFFDIEPNARMTIHGESATTFELAEEFTLKTPEIGLSLVVSLNEGEGQFLGHLMQGNRPSQIQLNGSHRFKAYDWQLFFRTLRRSTTCYLKAILHIHS